MGDDLLIWIFKGYGVNLDPKLFNYYEQKKDLYNEGVKIMVIYCNNVFLYMYIG